MNAVPTWGSPVGDGAIRVRTLIRSPLPPKRLGRFGQTVTWRWNATHSATSRRRAKSAR